MATTKIGRAINLKQARHPDSVRIFAASGVTSTEPADIPATKTAMAKARRSVNQFAITTALGPIPEAPTPIPMSRKLANSPGNE